MSDEQKEPIVKPLFLIKPRTMSPDDIKRVEEQCGIVIVECEEPDAVRLLEPPVSADISEQARASLQVMRKILALPDGTMNRGQVTRWFVELMLAPVPERVARVKRK